MIRDGRWEREVRDLYVRDADMEVTEFEALLDVAIRGERPDHPDLPAYLELGSGAHSHETRPERAASEEGR